MPGCIGRASYGSRSDLSGDLPDLSDEIHEDPALLASLPPAQRRHGLRSIGPTHASLPAPFTVECSSWSDRRKQASTNIRQRIQTATPFPRHNSADFKMNEQRILLLVFQVGEQQYCPLSILSNTYIRHEYF